MAWRWLTQEHTSVTNDDQTVTIPAVASNRDWRELVASGEAIGDPPDIPFAAVISDRQFFQVLAMNEFITQQEALDAVMVGAVPPAMQGFIDALPEEMQWPAKMVLCGATQFDRNHPLVQTFASALGMAPLQVDLLWAQAGTL